MIDEPETGGQKHETSFPQPCISASCRVLWSGHCNGEKIINYLFFDTLERAFQRNSFGIDWICTKLRAKAPKTGY